MAIGPGPTTRKPPQSSSAGRRGRRRRRARFERRAERAIASGHIFRYLAGAMSVVAAAAGVTAWLIDRRDFHTLGDGLWWALVTLATVGYGDIVPHTAWGRVVGAVVIVLGVTFLSLLTATITSYFVSAGQDARADDAEEQRRDATTADASVLDEILERVTAIEDALRERPGPGAGT
jgi:voltage-gated potassium channel